MELAAQSTISNPPERTRESYVQKLSEMAKGVRSELWTAVGEVDDPISQAQRELLALEKQPEPHQTITTPKNLLRVGEAVSTNYHTMMEYVAHLTNAEFKPSELKLAERIHEKARGKYQGQYSAIRDVVRGSLVFETLEDLYWAVTQIHGLVKIVHVEDSFVDPKKSGYMDLKLILQFEGPNGEPFLTEAQLHLKDLVSAQKKERDQYVLRRNAEAQKQSMAEEDVKIPYVEKYIGYLNRQGRKAYEASARDYLEKRKRHRRAS